MGVNSCLPIWGPPPPKGVQPWADFGDEFLGALKKKLATTPDDEAQVGVRFLGFHRRTFAWFSSFNYLFALCFRGGFRVAVNLGTVFFFLQLRVTTENL